MPLDHIVSLEKVGSHGATKKRLSPSSETAASSDDVQHSPAKSSGCCSTFISQDVHDMILCSREEERMRALWNFGVRSTPYPVIHHYPRVEIGSLCLHREMYPIELGALTCGYIPRFNSFKTPQIPLISNGYAFTAEPIRLGEEFVVKVIRSSGDGYMSSSSNIPLFRRGLGFGFTSWDPTTKKSNLDFDLPLHPESLLKRNQIGETPSGVPEFWTLDVDGGAECDDGDEFLVSTDPNTGDIYLGRNGGEQRKLMMSVPTTMVLWAFFALFGTTTEICLVGRIGCETS